MINFIGCSCDKCNEKFTSESDIVVCPECGTPHHRHCYEELGHCVNQDKHAEGFEWKAPEREPNFKANICPRCQAENPKDAAFCEKCGIALAPQAKTQRTESNMPPVLEDFRQSRQKTSVVPPTLPKYLEGETDGVSYKDIAIYVGESAPYYVYHFKNLNSGTKRFRPFCWSAFFFDGFYFLYRKMWLEALSVILISGIFSLPSMLLLLESTGVIAPEVLAGFGNINTFVIIGSILSAAYKIFLGYWAIPRYCKKVCRDLKRIKAQSTSNNEYYQTIIRKSGPSKPMLYLAIILCVLYLFI